jgi:glutathione synthase/RimK-type ligase-like ATP-grasp enzyme
MKQYDIAILTDARYVNPSIIDEHIENVLLEDQIVKAALEKRGFTLIKVDWASKEFDWTSVEYAIFRSTWDYAERFDEFSLWCEEVQKTVQLINPYPQLCWNMDKHYLLEISAKGINIPTSLFIEPKQKASLSELLKNRNWSQSVLKPAISAGGRHTYKLDENNISDHEEVFQELILNESMMLQPFLTNIPLKGELSLMMMNGKFTHAVVKNVKKGDFRVQDDFGGTVQPYTPNEQEIDFAKAVVEACDPLPLYARVDIVLDNNNELALSELELIEPELWFRFNPEAADVLAEGIEKMINGKREGLLKDTTL